MASRRVPSPRKDRYEPYARDREVRGDGYQRPRSRSPRRARDPAPNDPYGREARDRDRDGGRVNPGDRDRAYPPRDLDRDGFRQDRDGRNGARDGRNGRDGYGGGYRRDRERDDYDYDRPLDRRAIEEKRRKREEERARGVVLEDPTVTRDRGESPEPVNHHNDGDAEEGEEQEEDPMAAMMGFGGFNSTKGKGIGQNAEGAVKVHKQRTWRQYMNRRGGFNRPLDKIK